MPAEQPNEKYTTHSDIPFWRDERVLRTAAQIISAAIIIGLLAWITINFLQGANQRGMSLNFRFLSDPAEFPISDSVIPYDPSKSFGYAFLVGLIKTLLVSVIGIFFSTILGTLIGLARLSTNWLLSHLALAYIEFHRNIPLLVLLFLWYFPVFSSLPPVGESIQVGDSVYINERGLYLPMPRLNEGGLIWLISLILGIVLATIAWKVLRSRQENTGQSTYFAPISLAILIILPAIGWFLAGNIPIRFEAPYFEGFNYQGGLRITPEFAALVIGLTMYTAAFIAEVVRAGVQSVDRGQIEAARAIGLNQFRVLGLVVLPQALRVIIPPLISQYLNLAKNSSLAFFIGYQEVFSVGKIAINQAGRAIPVFLMVMVSYWLISLFTSWILNLYNRRIQFVER
jgi:general L-amino acid transport system permease protein